MPRNALEQVPDARVLPLEEIAAELVRLTAEELADEEPQPVHSQSTEEKETRFLELQMPQIDEEERPGYPSPTGN